MIEIIEYISVIAPGAVSVIGIVISLIAGAAKLRQTIVDFKNDKDVLLKELKESDEGYKKLINELVSQNKELTRVNKLLTDRLAKVKGYCDAKDKNI